MKNLRAAHVEMHAGARSSQQRRYLQLLLRRPVVEVNCTRDAKDEATMRSKKAVRSRERAQ